MEEAVWSAEDTTPAAIDGALRKLLAERHAADEAVVPARVLNLVAIVDREWRGEIENRLERVGRYHPSRTIICAVQERRTQLDAWASMSAEESHKPGEIAVAAERVEIDMGLEHLDRIESIVDPLLVPDLITVVWAPHGHYKAVEALLDLVQVVLLDSVEEPDPLVAVDCVKRFQEDAYVVDLAWLRIMPWRVRIAATLYLLLWRYTY